MLQGSEAAPVHHALERKHSVKRTCEVCQLSPVPGARALLPDPNARRGGPATPCIPEASSRRRCPTPEDYCSAWDVTRRRGRCHPPLRVAGAVVAAPAPPLAAEVRSH